jgi:cell division protease FtsH
METIDEEVARILREASERATTLLSAQRGQLEKLTQALLVKEEMNEQEIAQILGPSIHAKSNGHPGQTPADLEPVKEAEPA